MIAYEKQSDVKLKEFSPRVETYVQFYRPDAELGDVAWNDAHFLGRLELWSQCAGSVVFFRSPS